MNRYVARIIACSVLLLMMSGQVFATGEPSADAKGMPGALGTFEFKPADWQEGQTTWWEDSDGVMPGVPGCHIGTDNNGVPNGRMFGGRESSGLKT